MSLREMCPHYVREYGGFASFGRRPHIPPSGGTFRIAAHSAVRLHIPPSGGTFRIAAHYLTTIFCVFTFSPTNLNT
ncbi:MAG: hypothetical protein IJK92_09815 [Bacteroidales bacterium]|nr:hypothetical protein [Bacteroidales bacterium]